MKSQFKAFLLLAPARVFFNAKAATAAAAEKRGFNL